VRVGLNGALDTDKHGRVSLAFVSRSVAVLKVQEVSSKGWIVRIGCWTLHHVASESVYCYHLEIVKKFVLLANLVAVSHWIRLRHAVRDECAVTILVGVARQKNDQAVFVYVLTTNLVGLGADVNPSTTFAFVRVRYLAGSKLELRWSLCLLGVDNVTRSAGGTLLCDACLQFTSDFVLIACIPREFGRAIGEEADALESYRVELVLAKPDVILLDVLEEDGGRLLQRF
jgi:hypothetical protein